MLPDTQQSYLSGRHYIGFDRQLLHLLPHQILAINRGEKLKVLKVPTPHPCCPDGLSTPHRCACGLSGAR